MAMLSSEKNTSSLAAEKGIVYSTGSARDSFLLGGPTSMGGTGTSDLRIQLNFDKQSTLTEKSK
jgi:hypothetical protein